jgi:hypothetical protein
MSEKEYTVHNVWRYKKYYVSVTQMVNGKEEEKFYKAPYEGLRFKIDMTGYLYPTNAVQEFKQVLNPDLKKNVAVFRKEYRKYAKAYWDMLPETVVGGHQETDLPKEFRDFKLDKFEFLRWIKANAYTYGPWEPHGTPRKHTMLTQEQAVKRWLDRFAEYYYAAHKKEHILQKVPIGTACPKHRH